MKRPAVHEWAVLGEDSDPVPGDPDAVAVLGQALRDTADTIWREAGEIKAFRVREVLEIQGRGPVP